MKHPQKLPGLIAICLLLNCLPGNVQAQVGNEQATQKVTDAWISVTSMAFPEVSVALEAGKQMLEMLGVFDKPDATAEAIKKINQRLDELGRRIKNVEKSVNELKNDFFKEKNWTRLQTLKTRRELLQNLAVQLKRPSDDKQVKRDLAKAVGSIADDFLDPELWNWSDMYQGQMKDPDIKPLPTLELYA